MHRTFFVIFHDFQSLWEPWEKQNMFLNHTQNITQVTCLCKTDQCNDNLSYVKVPLTKSHMFNLPQLIWGLPYSKWSQLFACWAIFHVFWLLIFFKIIFWKNSFRITISVKQFGSRSGLLDLILYVPSTIFQLCRDGSSWVKPVLS